MSPTQASLSGDEPTAAFAILRRRSAVVATLVFLLLALAAGAAWWARGHERRGEAAAPKTPLRLVVRVLAERPHDPEAFTQGLVWRRGKLYESTGRYGRSTLRRVDPVSGRVERQVELEADLFGEGLARVGDRLIQLTWREGVGLTWDLESLTETGRFRYSGEGWGLCFDGRRLVMSDGSDVLRLRDPESFEEIARVGVRLAGRPVRGLNELECAEGWIYANALGSDTIYRIDGETGEVRATVDASGLLDPTWASGTDVLNGIAYDAERGVFLLTGKLWPRLFEVTFVER